MDTVNVEGDAVSMKFSNGDVALSLHRVENNMKEIAERFDGELVRVVTVDGRPLLLLDFSDDVNVSLFKDLEE